MKTIVYGIFAEDDANKLFIINALPQLVTFFDVEINLKHEADYTSMAVAKNSEFVVDNFMDRAVQGFRYYGLDLCIVSVDREDRDFKTMLKKMNNKLPNQGFEDKVFIFIPVQCIEYWLWYLKFSDKEEKIETSKTRKEVKKELYRSAKSSNSKTNPIVKEITQTIDFELLVKKSESFNYFFKTFKTFIEKL